MGFQLTESNVKEFIQDYEDGMTVRVMSKKYHASAATIITHLRVLRACRATYTTTVSPAVPVVKSYSKATQTEEIQGPPVANTLAQCEEQLVVICGLDSLSGR